MKQRLVVGLVALGLVVSACGAKGADEAESAKSSTPTSSAVTPTNGEADTTTFGTLESPCGPGDAKVSAADAGTGTDKLYIGVGNDRSGTIRPGLLKDLYDGATGFANWCNAQGGVSGLPLEVVDLDGKLLEVEAAMTTACTSVFALVGGGWAQDNLIFTGKEGSDFHKCGLIAIPGFAVSVEFGQASDQVQPIPGTGELQITSPLEGLASAHPDLIGHYGVVSVNLPSVDQKAEQAIGVARQVDGFGQFDQIKYDPINQDWGLIAQQVIDGGLTAVTYLGEPSALSKFSQALHDQSWNGVILSESNAYDSITIESSGPTAAEGVVARIPFHPYEEADRWPVTAQFMKIMDDNVPGWQRSAITPQAFSATMMFAQVAQECAAQGEITRKCVLTTAQGVHEWDAGGLHGSGDPGKAIPSACSVLVQVKDGKFERLYPEIGSADDDGDGFHCSDLATVDGDFSGGNKDSSILDK